MQLRAEVERVVLVWIHDQEILELIRDLLEPLGYTVEFAPDGAVRGETIQ
jgi:CheY-like chemotaxis protein